MKPGIHPEYMPSKITCACGRETETYATVEEIHVEICSHCHPFYTGRQKLVDTAGRVERFRRKYGSTDDETESDADGTEADSAASPEAEADTDVPSESEAAEAAEEPAPQPVGAAGGGEGEDEPSNEDED